MKMEETKKMLLKKDLTMEASRKITTKYRSWRCSDWLHLVKISRTLPTPCMATTSVATKSSSLQPARVTMKSALRSQTTLTYSKLAVLERHCPASIKPCLNRPSPRAHWDRRSAWSLTRLITSKRSIQSLSSLKRSPRPSETARMGVLYLPRNNLLKISWKS